MNTFVTKLKAKVYGTIAAKKKAIEAALEKLTTDPEKVKNIASWHWIQRSVMMLLIHSWCLIEQLV